MLIVYGVVEQAAEGTIEVAKKDSGWVLSVKGGKSPWNFEFDGSLVEKRPDTAFMMIDRSGLPKLVWASEIFHDRAGFPFATSRKNIPASAPFVASFSVDESSEVHCFVLSRNVWVGDLKYIVAQPEHTHSEAIQSLVPSLSKFCRTAAAKKKLLSKVILSDSLAALEAQIDLLTNLVMVLLAKVPADERPELGLQLKQIVDAHGTATIHSNEALLTSVKEHKIHMRGLQSVYFAERDKEPVQ